MGEMEAMGKAVIVRSADRDSQAKAESRCPLESLGLVVPSLKANLASVGLTM